MPEKDEIINKLLRYSREIGDRTPGEHKFYEYAEIGIYDLHKLGWSNYRELVLDAGLTPNKFDKTKYSHEQLCRLFINVIREKGKWPTRGELEVKHYQESNFPDAGTFYNKLGLTLTGDLARKILEYVGDKRGYKDIVDICNTFLENNVTQEASSFISNVGYVYLLKSTLRNATAYKIGHAKDIKNRVKQLRQPSNEEILIHQIKTDDPIGVEKYWHDRFESKRLYPYKFKDEWFKLKPSDVKAFKRWKRIL
jgi:hypothetical protein